MTETKRSVFQDAVAIAVKWLYQVHDVDYAQGEIDNLNRRYSAAIDPETPGQQKCPYCHGQKKLIENKDYDGTDVLIDESGLHLPRNENGVEASVEIHYCPMCGRKLEES